MVEAQYQGDSLGEADRRPPSSEDLISQVLHTGWDRKIWL